MSICATSPRIWGHYDENGQWQREKFCFVSCGSRCDCMPPSMIPKKNEEEIIFTSRDIKENNLG